MFDPIHKAVEERSLVSDKTNATSWGTALAVSGTARHEGSETRLQCVVATVNLRYPAIVIHGSLPANRGGRRAVPQQYHVSKTGRLYFFP